MASSWRSTRGTSSSYWPRRAPSTNNGNGRDDRATEVTFDGEEGLATFTWWKEMVDSGLALNVGRNATGADHILALSAEQAEMTIGTSSALRTVINILASGNFPDIELGVGPLPSLPDSTGGVVVGGAALYIMASRPPEEQQAAWEFIKFLASAETQAEWFSGSGYIPTRVSSHDLAPALEVVRQYPQFQVPVDQLAESPETAASTGPLMGAYPQVRQAVATAIEEMLLQAGPAVAWRSRRRPRSYPKLQRTVAVGAAPEPRTQNTACPILPCPVMRYPATSCS
jgi:sn-glycerol 3-phosphate transport system substrate-binding protein